MSRNSLISSASAESRLSTLVSGVVNPSTRFEQGLYVMQTFAGTSSQRSTRARPEWPEGEGAVCVISQQALNYVDEVIRARTRWVDRKCDCGRRFEEKANLVTD